MFKNKKGETKTQALECLYGRSMAAIISPELLHCLQCNTQHPNVLNSLSFTYHITGDKAHLSSFADYEIFQSRNVQIADNHSFAP